MYGEKYYMDFIGNLFLSPAVKEFSTDFQNSFTAAASAVIAGRTMSRLIDSS